jgi:hypothetical protein
LQATDSPRERARAALRANPDATLTAVAKPAKVSRSTVVNARDDLAAEARKQAPKPRATSNTAKPPTERRQRAQKFLKDALASGPRRVSDIEEAAAKAHVELPTLAQARGDLGVVVSRANTGGAVVSRPKFGDVAGLDFGNRLVQLAGIRWRTHQMQLTVCDLQNRTPTCAPYRPPSRRDGFANRLTSR